MGLSSDLVGTPLPAVDLEWDERDVMLYALGVGARPATELALVYEGLGPVVLPTFALVASLEAVKTIGTLFAPDRYAMVHATQHLDLPRPLEPRGRVQVEARVSGLWDKGKHSLIELTSEGTHDHELLFRARATTMVLNSGGWGGERGPSPSGDAPDRQPDAVITDHIRAEQAAIFRLSGDRNPIHIDPEAAKRFGFEDVFLHGLCTMGFAARAVVHAAADGDPTRLAGISCRFASRVPLDCDISTRVWDGDLIAFETRVADEVALAAGRATLRQP